MKILEINIERFGMLRERSIRFDGGLNVLSGENESGKSTVLSFIRYMLYGLPGTKSAHITDADRFGNDGAIGGTLTYQTDGGAQFRLERHTTDDGRDRAQLVDLASGRVTADPEPGKRLFGVSEKVFSGTAFVSQADGIGVAGLSGAIENILTSADVTVSVQKAADRLNQARRTLSPKKGDGGEIAQKKAALAAMEEELAHSRENVRATCDTEAALREAKKKRIALEEKKNAIAAKLSACDTFLLGRRIDLLADTEKKLSGYESALAVLNAPPYAHLTDTASSLADRYKAAQEIPVQTPPADNGPGTETAAEAYEEGEYWESKSRLHLALGISMVIAGLLGLAAAIVMIWFAFPVNQFVVPLVATAICLALGIVFYVLQGRSVRQLNAILDDWAMETLDDLGALAETEDKFPEVTLPRGAAAEATEEVAGIAEEIRALAVSCGVVHADNAADADVDTLLTALREKGRKADADRSLVIGKIENFRGRIAVLREQVGSADRAEVAARCRELIRTPLGKEALSMDADGFKKLQREREFTESAWTAQFKRESELEKAFAAQNNAGLTPPNVLSTRIYALRREIADLETRAAGFEMAYDALRTAGESLRADVTPQITERASQYMRQVTGGKYGSLHVDPSFALTCQTSRGTVPIDTLSGGTAAAAYIALRLALMDVLFAGHESAPLFADEAFSALDLPRLRAVLELLASSGRQSLLCTCRPCDVVGNVIRL